MLSQCQISALDMDSTLKQGIWYDTVYVYSVLCVGMHTLYIFRREITPETVKCTCTPTVHVVKILNQCILPRFNVETRQMVRYSLCGQCFCVLACIHCIYSA